MLDCICYDAFYDCKCAPFINFINDLMENERILYTPGAWNRRLYHALNSYQMHFKFANKCSIVFVMMRSTIASVLLLSILSTILWKTREYCTRPAHGIGGFTMP